MLTYLVTYAARLQLRCISPAKATSSMPKLLTSAYLLRLFRMGESDYYLHDLHIYMRSLARPYSARFCLLSAYFAWGRVIIICMIFTFTCALLPDLTPPDFACYPHDILHYISQKPFSGKKKYIYIFYSFRTNCYVVKNWHFVTSFRLNRFPTLNAMTQSYLTKETAVSR